MPNFEKLIKQQQSNSNERLRVVESTSENSIKRNDSKPNFAGTQAFFGAIFGSIVGSIAILTAIELGLVKVQTIIDFLG